MTEEMVCENCGATLSGKASFCKSCGMLVYVRSNAKCLCGNDNPSNANFCSTCGASLSFTAVSGMLESPRIGFAEAIIKGFLNYINFNGRATRAETWWWVLFCLIGRIILDILGWITGLVGVPGLLFFVFAIMPLLSVCTRRLHDINRTGWWLFLGFVPVIGWIVLILWTIQRGEKGTNRYGQDPRRLP